MSGSAAATMAEHTLTEFLQHSGKVLAEVERGGIVLHRRDGEDLVVLTRSQNEALSTTVRALAGAVLDPPNGEHRTVAVLPWLAFLSSQDRADCLRELSEVATAAVATGQLSHLEESLDQWRATGLAAWDEQRLRRRDDYAEYVRDDPLPLTRP